VGKAVRILIDWCQEGSPRRGSSDAEKAAVILALERSIFGPRVQVDSVEERKVEVGVVKT
jgi:hypothetical protein